MEQKKILREKYYRLRKKKYFEIDKEFFSPLIRLIKTKFKKRLLKLALYYPSNFEVNVLKFLEYDYMKNQNVLIPSIKGLNDMNFHQWKKNEILFVNKFNHFSTFFNKKTNCCCSFHAILCQPRDFFFGVWHDFCFVLFRVKKSLKSSKYVKVQELIFKKA